MLQLSRGALVASSMAAVVLLSGCATKITASSRSNPAPAEPFVNFGRIDVKPAVLRPGLQANMAGLAKIQENIQFDLKASLPAWNQGAGNGRSLVIEPVVEELSFKHGAGRVLLGPLAGSSGVLLRLNIKDGNGKVIGTPEFFQRAGAMSAGWTFGVHDNLMLTRVANLASGYIKANYRSAVGGPTGADDKAIAK